MTSMNSFNYSVIRLRSSVVPTGIIGPCETDERTLSMTTPPARLQLGHSPDSDDAFMFYGLAEHMVDSEGLEFEHILRDIQTLNEWALEGKIECTAISVHAYAYVHDRYAIL